MRWIQFVIENFTKFRSVKYLVVGGISAIVDIFVFYLLFAELSFNIIASSVIAFCFAVVVNYFIGNMFVFESKIRFMKTTEFSLIFIISASGLAWNIVLVYLMIYPMDMHPGISKIIAAAPVFLWNYTLRRNFIYKSKAVNDE